MHEIVLKAAASLVLATTLYAIQCEPITYSALQKENKGKKRHVVFFASWCAECAESLKKYKDHKGFLFVSAFDEKERAEAVANKFGLDRCFLDTDIAKTLKVTGVPSVKEVQF